MRGPYLKFSDFITHFFSFLLHCYKIYLQTKQIQHYTEYKKLRAKVRKLTRKYRREDWDKFVKSIECNITGPQRRGFKYYKKLHKG